MSEEEALLQDARAGSEDAFCGLVRLHQRRVRTYLGRFVRDAEVADELAQDAFIAAHRTLDTYRGEAPFGTWLVGIARNLALRHLQDEARRRAREARELPSLLAAWRAQRAESPDAEPARHERKLAALGDCLKELPAGSGRLVQGHYYRRESAVLLAREMGKNSSAVRMMLLRIRLALRRCVERKLSGEGAQA